MQHLNEYLLGKDKKNAISYDLHKDYCILVMYDVDKHIADEIKKEFKYAYVPNNINSNGSDYYVIPVEDAEKYINRSDCLGIILYEIPDSCKTIEDVKADLKDGRIEEDDLKVLYICLENKKPMYEFLLSNDNPKASTSLDFGMKVDDFIKWLEKNGYERNTKGQPYDYSIDQYVICYDHVDVMKHGKPNDERIIVKFDDNKEINSCFWHTRIRLKDRKIRKFDTVVKYVENKQMYEFLLSKTNKNIEQKLDIGMHLDQLIEYLEEHGYEDTSDNGKYYMLKKEFKVFSRNISIKRIGAIEDIPIFEVFFDKDKCITSCRLYFVRNASSFGSDIEGLKKYIENKQYK